MHFINSNIKVNIRKLDDAIETLMCETEPKEKDWAVEYLQTCGDMGDMELLQDVIGDTDFGKLVLNIMGGVHLLQSLDRIQYCSMQSKYELIKALKEEFIGE